MLGSQPTRSKKKSYTDGLYGSGFTWVGVRPFFMKTGYTFSKQERLCGTMQVDRLFAEGDRRIAAFPIRLVWLLTDDTEGVRILVSAPKRLFKHAVDRNRIKRQIREFYRTSSAALKETVASRHKGLLLAFLFTDSKLWESEQLNQRLAHALDKLVAELSKTASDKLENNSE